MAVFNEEDRLCRGLKQDVVEGFCYRENRIGRIGETLILFFLMEKELSS